jgi:DNA-binding response OmpR family regulator
VSLAGSTPQRSRPLRVVVIDDEPDTVITLLEILRDEGYEAEGYSSSKEAMKYIAALSPDVIISDLAMPNPSGWDMARKIRAALGDKPKLIAISGRYTKDSDRIAAEMSGFDHYLTKPCDPSVLLKLIEQTGTNGVPRRRR